MRSTQQYRRVVLSTKDGQVTVAVATIRIATNIGIPGRRRYRWRKRCKAVGVGDGTDDTMDQQQETKECRGANVEAQGQRPPPHASLASSDFSGCSTEAWLGGRLSREG